MKPDSTEARILVIGSAGGVGRQMCAEVARQCGPGALVLGDYRLERAESQAREHPGAASRRVDLRDATSIRDALDPELAGVIVCALQERPEVQSACLERGIPCLDVTGEQEFIVRVHALDGPAREAGTPLLTMAGAWPGLSGLMTVRAAEMLDRVDAIDLALCQSTGSSVGPVGIADMMGSFSRPVSLREGAWVREVPGFSVKRRIEYPEPFGIRRHRLVDFVEGPVLAEALGLAEVRLWTGFDSAAFDGLVSLLRRLGVLALFRRKGLGLRLARGVNAIKRLGPTGPEPIAVVALARGERGGRPARASVSLRGPSDYGLTAMSAVAFARLVAMRGAEAAGAGHPLRLFQLREVIEAIDHPELEVFESAPKSSAPR
jgi:saccharopine dehydrogenase-like NADP-dependent oxidoreductase